MSDPADLEYKKDLESVTRVRRLLEEWDADPRRDTCHDLQYARYMLHCLRGRIKRKHKQKKMCYNKTHE
jgi:hypothetical protein